MCGLSSDRPQISTDFPIMCFHIWVAHRSWGRIGRTGHNTIFGARLFRVHVSSVFMCGISKQKVAFSKEKKPPDATAKNTQRVFQFFLSRGSLFVWIFVNMCWWSLGVFGATWGSSEENRRSFLKQFRMMFSTVFFTFVGRSRIHPGVMFDHLWIFLNIREAPWHDMDGGREGFKSSYRCDVQPLLQTVSKQGQWNPQGRDHSI